MSTQNGLERGFHLGDFETVANDADP
jgi:hypothetical protein